MRLQPRQWLWGEEDCKQHTCCGREKTAAEARLPRAGWERLRRGRVGGSVSLKVEEKLVVKVGQDGTLEVPRPAPAGPAAPRRGDARGPGCRFGPWWGWRGRRRSCAPGASRGAAPCVVEGT